MTKNNQKYPERDLSKSPCYGCNPYVEDDQGYWCDFCWHSVIRNLDELEE